MASNPLIGTYRLVSWENKSVQDGQISRSLSKDTAGCIMCNQDGYMPVAIMSPHRLKCSLKSAVATSNALKGSRLTVKRRG
jgi:hypothetical protein